MFYLSVVGPSNAPALCPELKDLLMAVRGQVTDDWLVDDIEFMKDSCLAKVWEVVQSDARAVRA